MRGTRRVIYHCKQNDCFTVSASIPNLSLLFHAGDGIGRINFINPILRVFRVAVHSMLLC